MNNIKEIHIKTYTAEEIAENQFKVINEIRSESTSYDEKGNPISGYSHQNDGNITTDFYYENGLLVKEDSGYHTTTFKYNEKGNLIESIMEDDFGIHTKKMSYDENEHLIKEVYSYKKHYAREEEIQQINEYAYDDNGNLTEQIIDSDQPTAEYILFCYDDKNNKIAEKLVQDEYFELTEFVNDEVRTKRRYTCKAADAETFLDTDDFTKELIEVTKIRHEKKTEGDKIIEINTSIANDCVCSKEIIISDATTNHILKYYEVFYNCGESPIVTEKTIEYWD